VRPSLQITLQQQQLSVRRTPTVEKCLSFLWFVFSVAVILIPTSAEIEPIVEMQPNF